MKAQNLAALTQEARDLLALLMLRNNFPWTNSYMIEVHLDNPILNMLDGGQGLHVHAGNGSRDYAHHYGDNRWAIVHVEDEDVQDWDWQTMANNAKNQLENGHYDVFKEAW